MRKIILFTIAISTWGVALFAQGVMQQAWERHYSSGILKGTDMGMAVAVDDSGNVYVGGQSVDSEGKLDFIVIKYDALGTQQWTVRYNGEADDDDDLAALTVDHLGNVYVTGKTVGSNGMTDYVTIKYNSAGAQQWVAYYDGPGGYDDDATALAVDNNGNVYVTGSSMGSGMFVYPDYTTIKYNSAGEQQWVVRYNGSGNQYDEATAIAVDNSGKIVVTGASWGKGSSMDYATVCYASDGTKLWEARYNGPANSQDFATDLKIDVSGNAYITGISAGNGTSSDYATIKYDAMGNQLWVARYNSPENAQDDAAAIVVDDWGNVYVTGTIGAELYNQNSSFLTVKYNSTGEQQWAVSYDGTENQWDRVQAMTIDNVGDIYVTGQSVGEDLTSDFATIKYNSAGVLTWVERYQRSANSADGAMDIAVDHQGNVYVTGTTKMGVSEAEITTVKYSPTDDNSKLNDRYIKVEKLSQNYPNPFNAATVIKYRVPFSGHVTLKIFNVSGQEIEVLVDQYLPAGFHEVKWEAAELASGVYFYSLRAGSLTETRKLILLR